MSSISLRVAETSVPTHVWFQMLLHFWSFSISLTFFRAPLCIENVFILSYPNFLDVFSDGTFMLYYLPYSQKQKHWILAILPRLVIWFIKAHQLESSNSREEFTASEYMPFLGNNKEWEKAGKIDTDQNSMHCSPGTVWGQSSLHISRNLRGTHVLDLNYN